MCLVQRVKEEKETEDESHGNGTYALHHVAPGHFFAGCGAGAWLVHTRNGWTQLRPADAGGVHLCKPFYLVPDIEIQRSEWGHRANRF